MIMVIGDLPPCNLTKGAQQIYLFRGFSPCVVSKICLVICHLRKKKLSADLLVPSSDPRNNFGRITVPGPISFLKWRNGYCMTRHRNITKRYSALGYHTTPRASSPGRSSGGAGKERRACNNVDSKCSLAEITLVMIFYVCVNVCLHSCSFPLRADWRKSDSSVDGEPQGNWRWNPNSRDPVANSPSFSRSTAREPRGACSQAVTILTFIVTIGDI